MPVEFIWQGPAFKLESEEDLEPNMDGPRLPPPKARRVNNRRRLVEVETEPDDPGVNQAELDWLTSQQMGE
jgi:hypothetical protein